MKRENDRLDDEITEYVTGKAVQAEGAQGERTEDGDTIINRLRLGGLSIDGDNAYKSDILDCVVGALAFGFQGRPAPEESHWLHRFWEIGNAEREARAALAQPSPHCSTCNDTALIGDLPLECPDCCGMELQPSPAPELEQPEVVAWQYRVAAGPQTGWSLWHPGKGEEYERSYTVERRQLMTVAQHDRIIGVRAEAICLLADSVVRLRAERDAAQTRVAELEKQESVAWLAYYFGGKRNGTVYGGPCDTKEEMDRYIQQVERSDDSISLEGRPLYAAPVAKAGQVPEGWKLVPIEPTGEMIAAGFDNLPGRMYGDKEERDAELIWDAMLAAAPAQGGE